MLIAGDGKESAETEGVPLCHDRSGSGDWSVYCHFDSGPLFSDRIMSIRVHHRSRKHFIDWHHIGSERIFNVSSFSFGTESKRRQ